MGTEFKWLGQSSNETQRDAPFFPHRNSTPQSRKKRPANRFLRKNNNDLDVTKKKTIPLQGVFDKTHPLLWSFLTNKVSIDRCTYYGMKCVLYLDLKRF